MILSKLLIAYAWACILKFGNSFGDDPLATEAPATIRTGYSFAWPWTMTLPWYTTTEIEQPLRYQVTADDLARTAVFVGKKLVEQSKATTESRDTFMADEVPGHLEVRFIRPLTGYTCDYIENRQAAF